ncbi:hypothetical protein EHP00_1577 [Ecytonucleospora hepatopenaei]|uniref:Uncharacterized protein n=1 Tax=Ecytonucleospora hepatopenaei TaxID=646526 RepID=A0A1W0E8S4_9MICR|nr:hypothetical protein EHP00_1577 [Ecytonucleospora hepatopenaei]
MEERILIKILILINCLVLPKGNTMTLMLVLLLGGKQKQKKTNLSSKELELCLTLHVLFF